MPPPFASGRSFLSCPNETGPGFGLHILCLAPASALLFPLSKSQFIHTSGSSPRNSKSRATSQQIPPFHGRLNSKAKHCTHTHRPPHNTAHRHLQQRKRRQPHVSFDRDFYHQIRHTYTHKNTHTLRKALVAF
ncbi:hypothetical protein MN608_06096 [Microdochium nivale]|nr:hypothetical protein MN608_06096 [Microdochium nivale]